MTAILLYLDDLLERTVDGRAHVGDVLPEVDGGLGALGNALGGELELLYTLLVIIRKTTTVM